MSTEGCTLVQLRYFVCCVEQARNQWKTIYHTLKGVPHDTIKEWLLMVGKRLLTMA